MKTLKHDKQDKSVFMIEMTLGFFIKLLNSTQKRDGYIIMRLYLYLFLCLPSPIISITSNLFIFPNSINEKKKYGKYFSAPIYIIICYLNLVFLNTMLHNDKKQQQPSASNIKKYTRNHYSK